VRVTATAAAIEVIERCARERSGTLTITIGTGCCDSTAPFLYEDFFLGADQEVVGTAGGIEVFAPQHLRDLYAGDEAMVIDIITEPAESMSIETEHGVRFILRGRSVDLARGDECEAPAPARSRQQKTIAGRVQELPPHLQGVRFR